MTEKAESARFWSGTNAVVDNGWGDSGKGKIVDVGAQSADLVIRYNGGPNAGHTIKNERGEFKLHLMPSGIFNPDALCVITGGVVVNPFILSDEIEELRKSGIAISSSNLLISKGAHLIMPWHRTRDSLEEVARGGEKIGTTGQGIGPVYADRASRNGLRVGDLLDPHFEELFYRELVWQEKLTRLMSGQELGESANQFYDGDAILEQIRAAREFLSPLITNVMPVIFDHEKNGKNILGEGAQGALLDLDLGTYPYVTSSNPGLSGFVKSTGIDPRGINRVIGVTKAYTTRVGDGPMPTELLDETGEHIRQKGNEFGAVTGRPRRCGWLDIPAMKFGARVVSANSIALTKLDIFDGMSEVKICVGYEHNGRQYDTLPDPDPRFLQEVKPIYETVLGWDEETTGCESFSELPANAKAYVLEVQEQLGLPIEIVSVGPDRQATIYRSS